MNFALNRIAVVTTVSLVLMVGAAHAGHQERPDLVQVDDTFTDTNQPSGVTGTAELLMDGSEVSGSIDLTVSNGTTSGGFWADIQDFDKATKTRRTAELRNRMWSYVGAWTYEDSTNNSSVGSSSIRSCKMRIAARDTDGDLDPDQARWMMGCNNSVLDDLGMSQAAQDRLIALFREVRPRGANARTLRYTGKGPID